MPSRPVGVTDTTNASGVAEVDTVERASPDIVTTTTADPGTGTSLAVTLRDKFPQSGNFKIRVEAEVMLVTAGQGTGAGTFTVTRGQDGTTNVAHTSGVTVAYVVAVQRVSPIDERQVSYIGYAATFKTLGRAGTTGQKIFAIHNATGSKVLCDVDKITVDLMQTVAKVVEPPDVRLWRFTAVPTNGSAVTKVPQDTTLTSNASVTLWQDSSADNTGCGTTLTVTLPAATVITQSWAARALTLVGYEQFDREKFLDGDGEVMTLRPLEGVCVFLDYTVATANPTTDKWIVTCRWVEYTLA
jgi:hypothetical protein